MLEVSERKEPQLRKYLHKIQLEGILLIDDWWGNAQLIVGGAISGPGFYNQASKQHLSLVFVSLPVSRILPCINFCPHFLQ